MAPPRPDERSGSCLSVSGYSDVTTTTPAIKPIKEIGGFFAMSLDAMVAALAPPFAFREFVLQTWFVARVSLLPTMMLSIPFCTLVVFMANIMLGEIGASDASGTGAAMACVNQIGPIVTVVVVAGAGATAMCADLGARTIREELDAMRVMGIDPIQRLVDPRVLAATLVALLLNGVVTIVGLMGSFFFSVYVQHVAPGAFVAGLTLLVGLPEIVIATVKALLFGFAAGLIACYKGMTVGGGSQGVGTAVNETVVYAFMALFVINVLVTAIGFQVS